MCWFTGYGCYGFEAFFFLQTNMGEEQMNFWKMFFGFWCTWKLGKELANYTSQKKNHLPTMDV